MARVTLTGVSKSFGTVEVVHDLDLEVADTEFVVLVGPSGCGKSTILRMIAGLEEASQGDILIGDRLVNNVPPKHRDIAMVFQNYALYPHMSVYRNMAFALRAKRLEPAEIDRKVKAAAAILGLEEYLERRPGELSGGQRQRVAMGRAIVRDPAVFLFDEPLSNLDAKLRTQMRAEIKKLHQRLRTTIIYVTHDQVEAMTLADRIVILRQGRVEQIGTPGEVYRRPANLFVAGFIGTPAMNFLPARLAEGGVVLADGSRWSLPRRPAAEAGREVIIGLRPEDVRLADGPAAGRFEARVSIVEPLGPESLITVLFAGQEVVAKADGDAAPGIGTPLQLEANLQRLHLFDQTSGMALI
ncbi:MAG: sn-glycerol-3-phosphate ABC transporter ATP-binding protein UgpC [Proteobacteria bacterium]|nr:sn-glycerol-3-phosphate ABC transporter ATP-binding protein UgpC [Pseudomonadota bacterium]MBI3496805.1 sn-glycerol-3-phosphate ABC transporter ATP-binding protein UgpC [Pseudomonadota bacterium]